MPPTRRKTEGPASADLEETDLGAEGRGDVSESEDAFLVCRDQGTIRVLAIAAGETSSSGALRSRPS
jgi:hypothetical protein